jgi:hypothetical protein
VPGFVKTILASAGCCPYDQINRGQPQGRSGGVSQRQVAPIDEGTEQSAVHQVGIDSIDPGLVSLRRRRIGHVAGSGAVLPMVARGHMSLNRDRCDSEGRLRQHHPRNVCPHQPADEIGIGSVAADHAMGSEQEQVADPCDCRGRRKCRRIGSFGPSLVSADDDVIDFVGTEPGNFDRRVGDNKLLEFSLQLANGASLSA